MTNPFKNRLKRLHDAHQRGRDSEEGPSGVYSADDEEDEQSLETDETNEPSGYGWERLGATKTTDFGPPLWIATEQCDHDQDHGDWTIRHCSNIHHRGLADLEDDVPAETRRGDLLYMDIETTGLGDGAIAFMLGMGFWETEKNFVVEQLLLHDEDDEPALLNAFADRLDDHQLLVTFNGKRFDVPVLERRYNHHGIESPFDDGVHLDLLPLSRRNFPGLTSYKLSNLERQILSFERVDDVPGRDIPRRWWKFQKSLDPEVMRGVKEHNHHDIVSLEALVAAAIADEPPHKETEDSEPKWSFGRLGFNNSGQREKPTSSQKSSSSPAETNSSEETKPRSKIAQKLERTYRLRGKFAERGGVDDSSPEDESSRPTDDSDDSSPTFDAPPVDTSLPPQTGKAARKRVDELRSAARSLVDQKMWREAFPMLCELVALVPHDEEGLKMLAKYYRREGEQELARVFEVRAKAGGVG